MQSEVPVGIIGLGLMGTALAERLIGAGIPVIGFDVDFARCRKLRENHGTVAASVRELASRSPAIVVAVYSGAQAEALFADIANCHDQQTVICITTCSPGEILRLASLAANAGIAFVEAPISGTSAEARDGTATALIAGEARRDRSRRSATGYPLSTPHQGRTDRRCQPHQACDQSDPAEQPCGPGRRNCLCGGYGAGRVNLPGNGAPIRSLLARDG